MALPDDLVKDRARLYGANIADDIVAVAVAGCIGADASADWSQRSVQSLRAVIAGVAENAFLVGYAAGGEPEERRTVKRVRK